MDTAVYSALHMPIDICNIIISYANPVVNQIYIDNGMKYIYNDTIYNYHDSCTVGVINSHIYNFIISRNDYKTIDIPEARANIILPDKAYIIKYANGLICEHYDAITIYNINITNGIPTIKVRCSRKFNTKNLLLLYADSNYVIIKIDNIGANGITIYNHNLEYCITINTNFPVEYVALVSDILSYRTLIGRWFPIEL